MTIPTPQYVYRAALVKVTDGDTVVLQRDCGEHIYRYTTVRLLGVNCPELHGATTVAGHAAQAWVLAWLCAAALAGGTWPLVAETFLDKEDKYGRLLATIYRVSDGHCLNDDLIASGHALPWDGKGRAPVNVV